MELFRITQEKFAVDLSGNGSRIFGGRWNSEGYYALYASATRSLALLETLAHTPAKMLASNNYQLITLHAPDNPPTDSIPLDALPAGWDAADVRIFTQKIGDQFLTEKINLMIAVPSVVIREEMNYVINPLHTDMKKVTIINQRQIYFDNRVSAHL